MGLRRANKTRGLSCTVHTIMETSGILGNPALNNEAILSGGQERTAVLSPGQRAQTGKRRSPPRIGGLFSHVARGRGLCLTTFTQPYDKANDCKRGLLAGDVQTLAW